MSRTWVVLALVLALPASASAADLRSLPAAPFISGQVRGAEMSGGTVSVLLNPVGSGVYKGRRATAMYPLGSAQTDASGHFTWQTPVTQRLARTIAKTRGWVNVMVTAKSDGRAVTTFATRRAVVRDGRLTWTDHGPVKPMQLSVLPGARGVRAVRPAAMTSQIGGPAPCGYRHVGQPRTPTIVGEIHSWSHFTTTFSYAYSNSTSTTTNIGVTLPGEGWSIAANGSQTLTTGANHSYTVNAKNRQRFYVYMKTKWNLLKRHGKKCQDDVPRRVAVPKRIQGPISESPNDLDGTPVARGLDGMCPAITERGATNVRPGSTMGFTTTEDHTFTKGVSVDFPGFGTSFGTSTTTGSSNSIEHDFTAAPGVKKKKTFICSDDETPLQAGKVPLVIYVGSEAPSGTLR